MRKTPIVLTALLLISCGLAGSAKSQFDQLRRWIGRYPSSRIDIKTGAIQKYKTTFFAVPEIKPRLLQLLSKQDYTLLTKEYQVETPVQLVDDCLVASVCRPHNCGAENGSLAISLSDGSLFVTMYADDGKKQLRQWYSSKGKSARPPAAVKKVMEGG